MPSTALQRALFQQRRPVGAAIIAAVPVSRQSLATNQRSLSSSLQKLGHGPFTSNALSANNYTFVQQNPLVTFGKACIRDTTKGICAVQIRTFQNVGEYHNVADETMYSIQDAVEEYLEDHFGAEDSVEEDDIPEVNYASGVLKMYLPPHGTWVINKQTPNEQIWWSSPISGPRRYEYDEKMERWVYSRVVDEDQGADKSNATTYSEEDTLGGILNKEFVELFGEGLDDEFHC